LFPKFDNRLTDPHYQMCMTLLPLTRFAERPAYWVMGDRHTVLLTAEETRGQFSLFRLKVPAGRGSPPHVHRLEDETFVVVEGEVEFTAAGEARRTEPGDVVFGVRGIAPNFRNVGMGTARLLVITAPGGLEKFFAAPGVPGGSAGKRPRCRTTKTTRGC
jgi:quercetin dioxygenase-like cupin family protein